MRNLPNVASVCRVLPTPDDPSGGTFVLRRLEAVARRTRSRLVQPIPFFPGLRPLAGWARASGHDVNGVRIDHAPMFYLPKILKSLDGYWLYLAVLKKLQALKREGGLDVVDAHFGYPDGVGCVRAAQKLGIPVFVTIRGVEVDQLQTPLVGMQLRQALRRADGCIAVSHSLKQLAADAGVREDKIRVIHNAVDRELFRPGDKAVARQQLDVPPGSHLIVSVGNLLSVKCHHLLISSFAELLKQTSDARLVIIGGPMHEPAYPEELQALCERLSIRERVTFTGKLGQSDVATWLNAADLFALASKREGCCNAVLEALACGVPVVTTPVGDNTWFVKDGENGYIVPVGDSEAMTRAFLAAIKREDWDRHRISSGLQVGDWGRVADEVLEFFAARMEKRFAAGAACEGSA